jgi:DNA ligase-1
MDNPWRVISDLENHPSRLNKEAIVLAQAQQGNTEFFAGCRLALDSMITFGLKQIPEKTDADGPGLDWDSFSLIVTGFVNRSFTGNLARDTVANMMKTATKAQWNGWYRRILIKDMRAGFGENTINKVVEKKYAQYSIPVFSCQLAHDSANHESKVSGKKLIEVKLDGVRVITIVYPSGRVDQYSRNGKELVNFPHVKEQLSKIAAGFAEPMVLDGEIMSSSFQDLMKQIHRKSSAKANDAVLNLFDAMPLSQFETGKCATTQTDRSAWLKTWFEANEDHLPSVAVVGQELVDLDTPVGQKRYLEINQMAIDGGYEGIMLKDPEAGYVCKRTVAWMKLKPFIEVTLTAIAVEEGTGKNVGRMGAVLFEGLDNGKTIRVSVGSGWSDKDRDDIWQARKAVLGQLGEVRADAATLNQDSDDVYSLRFPRFKTWRGFVPGEKI